MDTLASYRLDASEYVNLHKCLIIRDPCRIHATRWRCAALGWPLRLSIKGEPSGCPSLRTPRLSGREEVRGRVRFPPSPPPASEVCSDLFRAAASASVICSEKKVHFT